MSAYATPRLELAPRGAPRQTERTETTSSIDSVSGGSLVDALIDRLAERLAERLGTAIDHSRADERNSEDEWLDCRHAAEYLGVHRDTLRKLAAERSIPSEQDGPGCKLYFRRSDLDGWRNGGGRPRHLAVAARRAA